MIRVQGQGLVQDLPVRVVQSVVAHTSRWVVGLAFALVRVEQVWGHSKAGRSVVGRSVAGRSEVGQSEAGRSEVGQSEVEHAGDGDDPVVVCSMTFEPEAVHN